MPGERILIVEDEVVVAMELESRLLGYGYRVEGICASGEEAVEKAGQIKPELVLMDIKLAGKVDGIQAAEQIHRQHDIPIVFLTAHSDETTLQRAKHSEPFGYLLKPFHEAELHTTVQVALYRHELDRRERDFAMRFSRVMKGIGGAMILTDENGLVRQMNPLAETLTGWDRHEAVGRHVTDVFVIKDPCTGQEVKNVTVECTDNTRGIMRADYFLIAGDQSTTPIESSFIPMEDENGRFLGVIVAFQENPGISTGKNHVSHAANLILAAELCKVDEDYTAAGSYYERALDLLSQSPDCDAARVTNLLRDLSHVYRNQGRLSEARAVEFRGSRWSYGRNVERNMAVSI